MNDKERYKKAFSVLKPSENFSLEVEKMAKLKKKQTWKTIAAAVAVCALIAAGGGSAYAADLGGIQRMFQIWIEGELTDVEVKYTPGESSSSYEMTYTDADGNPVERSGGGVAIEDDGTERPLTEEELMEEINAPDIRYEDDGTVMLYYYDQKVDLTDRFEDGVCYVKLEGPKGVLYLTAKYKGAFSSSPYKYASPDEFN